MAAAVIKAPPGYLERIAGVSSKLTSSLDWAQVFVKDLAEAQRLMPAAVKAVKPDGSLWFCCMKGGKKAGTDLNRDVLWEAMKPFGVTGVTLVSIDDTWSAMRFRPSDRATK